MIHSTRLTLAAGILSSVCVAGTANATDFQVFSWLAPARVQLGQAVHYRGTIVIPHAILSRPRWLPPDTSDALSWSALRPSRRASATGWGDTILVETTVQAFRLGTLAVPGLAFVDEARAPGVVRRLPTLRLTVLPMIPATDSTAELRRVRGPLAAPWWEIVPWLWVAGTALVLGSIAGWWWVGRKRRPVPVVVARVPTMSPGDRALASLDALRRRQLPEAGRFAEHALELTRIVRRFLEATTPGLRPGFTTTELSRRMGDEQMPPDDVGALVELMRGWDRVKFARAVSTVDEARRAERAVEGFVHRRRRPAGREAA